MLVSLIECLESSPEYSNNLAKCNTFATETVLIGQETAGLEQFTLLHYTAVSPGRCYALKLYNSAALSSSLKKLDRYNNTALDLALATNNTKFLDALHDFFP